MRNILGVTIGLLLLGSLAAAPALAEDNRPDQQDVDAICAAIHDVCEAVCDAKNGDFMSINWQLCMAACDGEQRICSGEGSSILHVAPRAKSLKQSFPAMTRN